jgi:DNA helicase-2/ATP-dependent DNA helicase PcrA
MRESEEKKLSLVRNAIKDQIIDLSERLKNRWAVVREARKEMWAETHVIRDFDDVATLAGSLSEVANHERQYADTHIRLSILKKMLDSPYFGRIDFVEDGYTDNEEIYIGRQSLFNEKDLTYYVYDWRAPISSMYYDFGVGAASFTAPDGPVCGQINLKRQYHIENGMIEYLFDSELTIDDEILQRELSKVSDAKLKTIIHSIQREQNQAIRCEANHVLIFGPAGSGKTSVGLHRLAYLLYKHRGSLTSAKVRIFSSNHIFGSYIAGIIPELGEEDVLTLDFKTLLMSYSTYDMSFWDSYEQLDCLTQADHPRKAWIAQKYNPDFIVFLEDFIKQYSPSLAEDALFNTDIVCTKERMAALFTDRTTAGNLAGKTTRVLEYVSLCYTEYLQEKRKDITRFFNDLHDENFSDDDIQRLFDEQKNIVTADLRRRLLPHAKRLYEKVLRAWARKHHIPYASLNVCLSALKRDKLYFEDALALFYIDVLCGRIKKERSVKHILIDEAQDMGHLQHRILLNLFDGCHFTVLADVNQALYPDVNLHRQDDLLRLYGGQATVIRLTKSYRSTYEISRFAGRVLGSFDESAYYKRMGGEPEIIKAQDPHQATLELLKEIPTEYNTVGILLADKHRAKAFYDQLNKLSPHTVALINDADDSFRPGVLVMAVPFAKGLEFDAVICPYYGDGVFEGEMGRKLLYLICTRALHRLYLVEG